MNHSLGFSPESGSFKAGCGCLNYGPIGAEFRDQSIDIGMMMTCAKIMALTAAEITVREKK